MAESQPAARLYCGQVMHHRFTPKRHRFIYRVFAACFDLDRLTELDKHTRGFSFNRFNLFSFHECDYGSGKLGLAEHIRQLLSRSGHEDACARIELLCYPRVLGYVFNPLSVYFCYDAQEQLKVVLYEVSNTFSQRHTYLITVNPEQQLLRHSCDKQMFVSPFTPRQGRYHFRIRPPEDQVAVCIRQTGPVEQANDQAILHATFTGQLQAFSGRSLLRNFFRYPLMTFKVIGAIHWEALKLWRKGVPLQPRDTTKTYSFSWQDSHGAYHHERI